jgi:hypothetical protein
VLDTEIVAPFIGMWLTTLLTLTLHEKNPATRLEIVLESETNRFLTSCCVIVEPPPRVPAYRTARASPRMSRPGCWKKALSSALTTDCHTWSGICNSRCCCSKTEYYFIGLRVQKAQVPLVLAVQSLVSGHHEGRCRWVSPHSVESPYCWQTGQ